MVLSRVPLSSMWPQVEVVIRMCRINQSHRMFKRVEVCMLLRINGRDAAARSVSALVPTRSCDFAYTQLRRLTTLPMFRSLAAVI